MNSSTPHGTQVDLTELDKMRLHIGIHTGFKRIDRDTNLRLIGSRTTYQPMRLLPRFTGAIKAALAAFQYLSAPLLHDLNRMHMVLELWEDDLHPVPRQELRKRIEEIQTWIIHHGGRP